MIETFKAIDTDGNGFITTKELYKCWEKFISKSENNND